MLQNGDISKTLRRIATLLELQNANPFRVRSYENAARIVEGLSRPVAELLESGEDLSKHRGIGEDLAGKIKSIADTGTVDILEKLEKKLPEGLVELVKLPGLGPKKVHQLYKELKIDSLEKLEKAARNGRIAKLSGFGEKTERNILENLKSQKKKGYAPRWKWIEAEQSANELIHHLNNVSGVGDVEVAGSYRRRKETVGDLDVLITSQRSAKVMDHFVAFESTKKVVSKGKTKSTIILTSGLQVDLRVIPKRSFGAALYYFTGSKAHNIHVRKRALEKGLKINEYGVFKGERMVAGKTEDEVFKKVGLPFIAPELREDRGEIEAAENGALPTLIELKDIRGDLHSHTTRTDGRNTLEEMAEKARQLGLEYLAITEHSKRVAMAKGLDEKALENHIKKIDKVNESLSNLTLLKGVEVDILKNGNLDLSDDVLKQLDVTICSVHYNRNMSREKMTDRVIRAMDNRHFNILGHPTGRLINERDPFDIDLEKIFEAAKERGCFVELNAQPDRLDLDDVYCKMAKEMGVKIAVSTDAHSVGGLEKMYCGIGQARRGWLEKKDVINARTLKSLLKLLKR